MTPAQPLSEQLLRLAHWMTAVRNGTHEMTAAGEDAFASALHACAEQAERLETLLQEARELAFLDAGKKVVAEVLPAGAGPQPTISSDHLTTLVAIACGHVPGVVLLPRRHARAIPCGESRTGDGGDAA